jgi:hypothetical protein
MKAQDLDTELKSLIKGIKLDSPGNEFTSNVMNRVFEEKAAMEKVKDERVLGKGFWIILFLFVILIAAMFIFSSSGIQDNGELTKLMDSAKDSAFSQGYKSVFSNLGTLPLSIGGILLGSSILVFIDRFLPQFMAHYLPQKSV